MVKNIIDYINTRITFIEKKHGLCEIVNQDGKTFPAEYDHNDNYIAVNFDYASSTIYHRKRGEVTTTESEESDISCQSLITKTFPLKLVAWVKKSTVQDNSYSDDKIALNIEKAIRFRTSPTLSVALGANTVSVVVNSYNTNRYEVWQAEHSTDMKARFDYALVSVDYEVSVTANQSCFDSYDCEGEADFNECGDCYATVIDGEETVSVQAGSTYECVNLISDPGTVSNSDDTFSEQVASGGTLELEDYTINIYVDGVLDSTVVSPAMVDVTLNITA